jgi:ribosomal subunit interface protein
MRVDIRGRGFELGESLRQHVERRARFAIGRFSPRIVTLSVRLVDTNGPRGGVDKSCVMTVRLQRLGEVHVSEQDDDPYVAVDRATERLGRAVARAIERRCEPRIGLVGPGIGAPLR